MCLSGLSWQMKRYTRIWMKILSLYSVCADNFTIIQHYNLFGYLFLHELEMGMGCDNAYVCYFLLFTTHINSSFVAMFLSLSQCSSLLLFVPLFSSPFIYVFLCVSLCLYVSLCVSLFLSVSLCFYLFLFASLSFSHSICLPHCSTTFYKMLCHLE